MGRQVSDIRRENLEKLILELYKGPKTRRELREAVGVGASTLSYLLSDLQRMGIIQRKSVIKGRGRPPELVRLLDGAWYTMGIKMGREKISGVLFGATGSILETTSVPIMASMRSNNGYTKALEEVLKKLRNRCPHPLAIGVCSSGVVDSGSHKILYSPVMNVTDLDVSKTVKKAFPNCKLVVMNDVDAVAAYEAFLNPDGDMLFVSYGVGIGMAYIIRGEVFKPSSMVSAFEFAHTLVSDEGECYCGQKGCLEYHASEYAVIKRHFKLQDTFVEFVEAEEERFHNHIEEIRALARESVKSVKKSYYEPLRILARALGNLVVLLRPAKIVIFGEGMVADWMVEMLEKHLKELFSPKMLGDVKVEWKTDMHLWERGASFNALKSSINRIIPFPASTKKK